MAILKRQFHYHEDGSHDEKWCYLARNTETGDVFVIREWVDSKGHQSEQQLAIGDFLASENSTATANLRALIGTLVPERQNS